MSNTIYYSKVSINLFLSFYLLMAVSWIVMWLTLGDSPYEQYLCSIAPFLVLSVCLIARHRQLSDVHIYFVLFYGLHYLVMPFLYGHDFVWVSFWRNEIFENWELLKYGVDLALLGLIGYSIGLLIGELRPLKKRNPLIPNSFFTKERISFVYKGFLLVGVLSWLAIAIQTPNPIHSILGRPDDRLSFPDIGGAYLYMLLFAAGHAYLLATLLIESPSILKRLRPFFLIFVLLLFLIKGARHELVILLLSFLIIHSNSQFIINQSFSDIFKRALLYGSIFVVTMSLLVFYTRYRSGLEPYAVNEIGYFLHSLADSAGFLMVILEVPSRFDYWYGMTYLAPIINHIPSIFFPDKLEYLYGVNRYTQLFYGENLTFDTTKVSHTYSLLGEIYFNFGAYGIPVLLGILGYVNSRLLLRFRLNASLIFKYLYALYVTNFLFYSVKSGFASGIIYYFQNIIVIFLLPVMVTAYFWRKNLVLEARGYPLATNL